MEEKNSERRWYAVHTYSGYEKKVKSNLERKVVSLGLGDFIFNILVPEADEKDENGKVVKRKIFPGYVLVEMIVTDKTWYDVRNTDGVTGFVGSGAKPIPLSEDEIQRILVQMNIEKVKPVTDLVVGDAVTINSGAFENFAAKVVAVDAEKGKIKVLTEMFGRETTVELDFDQVVKG